MRANAGLRLLSFALLVAFAATDALAGNTPTSSASGPRVKGPARSVGKSPAAKPAQPAAPPAAQPAPAAIPAIERPSAVEPAPPALAADVLLSWNDSKGRRAIIGFVERVTKPGKDFVPPAERIAVFDNDGTLWAEQPMYTQAFFVFDRVKALAPQHPEWKTQEPFASVLRGDLKSAMAGGEPAVLEMIMATSCGMTSHEYEHMVANWIAGAKHPQKKRPFTLMIYQPMVELLAYLRDNGFKTFIVSGGGVEFIRPWAEKVYGIPPNQVIGSTVKMKFEMRGDKPVIMRLPEVGFVDDRDGKPVGIETHIGRLPILAFGNSDADLQMLEWTCEQPGPRLCGLIHHTDAKREWAYDRASSVGRLDKGLEEAAHDGWTVVDMKADWKTVFPSP